MKKSKIWTWGTGIAIVYSLFALGIIGMVVNSFGKKLDLDSKDYYAKELVFQEQIDKSNRSKALAEPLSWKVETGKLLINYPASFTGKKLGGTITLFKPSNNNSDVNFPVQANAEMKQEIPTGTLGKGMYKLRIDWSADAQTYYNEGVVVLN
jgi:hypothetical protein